MAIINDNPVIIPEVVIPAKTYDIWWVEQLEVSAPDASYGTPIAVKIRFRLACRDENGRAEFHPTEPPREAFFGNVFGQAASVAPELPLYIDNAMNALGLMAKNDGTLR